MGFFNRRVGGWFSHNLQKPMEIVSYGSFGRPLLFVPTAAADFLEYERFNVIDVLQPFIDSGRVKVYSINSINDESWMNDEVHPYEKLERNLQWDRYVVEEVVPYIRHDCRSNSLRVAVAGASFGAFHAFNLLCRHPHLFDTVLAMSGFYDLSPHAKGCDHPQTYFFNPADYLPNLDDNYYLPKLKRECDIHIMTGQGPWEVPEESRRISAILNSRGVPHNLDLWGHDIEHDWPTWRKMLRYYVGERLGW